MTDRERVGDRDLLFEDAPPDDSQSASRRRPPLVEVRAVANPFQASNPVLRKCVVLLEGQKPGRGHKRPARLLSLQQQRLTANGWQRISGVLLRGVDVDWLLDELARARDWLRDMPPSRGESEIHNERRAHPGPAPAQQEESRTK